MRDIFTDGETLPNGIYVHRKTYWDDCEIKSWPQDKPWLAAVNIGGWHYSSQGEATKEQAVSGLLAYMQTQVISHKEQIAIQENRLKELINFLEVNNG